MRIGLATECLNRPQTGIEVATRMLVEGLGASGNQITCFHTPGALHPRPPGARHYLFRKPLPVPFYHRFASLFHHSCFDGLDVLHLPHPQLPYVWKPKPPVVITVHDLSPVLFPQFHNAKRVVFFKYVLPYFLRRADAIIAVSEATKQDVVRLFGVPAGKITVVPNAVDVPKRLPAGKRERFILYVGTLEPRKNIPGLLRAFALLKAQGYPHKLVLAGMKGWGYAPIFSLIRKLGLERDVVYRGYVSEEEKARLLRTAELFAYPSFYEGFGIPVLEAMAQGTPVVTSNVSSLPEVAGDAAILVDPSRPERIAQGMMEALSPQVWARLQGKGFKQAGRFTRKNMIDKTLRVYEGVVRR